jgi:glucose-1-phosphate thymidylyltransferase
MKGIILAGGNGTRLYPLTKYLSKQLLPIYDKPMVYYPLSMLMLSKINEILLITSPNFLSIYKKLLGDGRQFGLKISYKVQDEPRGLAEAFILGQDFIGSEKVCLILGDNLFYGQGLGELMRQAGNSEGATIFAYRVNNPQNFGVVEVDNNLRPISIEEKPLNPKSNLAVTGLYFYDNDVIKIAKSIKPSQRNELEITSINEAYLKEKKLNVQILGRGHTWLDTGTFSNLLAASQFVETIESRQGFKIACLEEIAVNNGWVTADKMLGFINQYQDSDYKRYLVDLYQ